MKTKMIIHIRDEKIEGHELQDGIYLSCTVPPGKYEVSATNTEDWLLAADDGRVYTVPYETLYMAGFEL